MEKKLIQIGYCAKVHGIKGGLSFTLENTSDSTLSNNSSIYIQKKNSEDVIEHEISSISFGNKVICFLKGVDNRNHAEELVPFTILLDRESLPEVDDDEIYLNDLIDFRVIDSETGKDIGVVKNFVDNGAQEILIIHKGNKELSIPFVPEFIKDIDTDKETIVILNPEFI